LSATILGIGIEQAWKLKLGIVAVYWEKELWSIDPITEGHSNIVIEEMGSSKKDACSDIIATPTRGSDFFMPMYLFLTKALKLFP
jgi:hypothetical protein